MNKENDMNRIVSRAIAGLLFTSVSLGGYSYTVTEYELSGGLGAGWYNANSPTTQVTPFEQDINHVTGASSNIIYSVGLGRRIFTDTFHAKNTVLTGLLAQLNYYYGTSTVRGDVWAYGSPNLSNYTFSAPFSSSRLMLDLKPELFVYEKFTPYAIIGGGAAWSDLSYAEQPVAAAYAPGAVTLGTHTNVTVAYDLGVGIGRDLVNNFNLSIEYFYTSFGRVAPSLTASSTQTIDSTPRFPISSQNLLVRLNWKIGDKWDWNMKDLYNDVYK